MNLTLDSSNCICNNWKWTNFGWYSGLISIPPAFFQFTPTKDEHITNFFPKIGQNYRNYDWLSALEILAAKNIDVNDLN